MEIVSECFVLSDCFVVQSIQSLDISLDISTIVTVVLVFGRNNCPYCV